MKKIIFPLLSVLLFSFNSFAEEDLFANLDYPELQVSPRATERLAQLAELEDKNGPLLEWTTISSGLMTFFAGYSHRGNYKISNPSDAAKKDSDLAANAGILVGASWMGIGTYMGFNHWSAARLADTKKITGKDKRADLARERMAEEALEFAANTTSSLEALSMWTNFAACVFITGFANDQNRIYSLIAATTSFLPQYFPNPYNLAYKKHREYKKKIYAPLMTMGLNENKQPIMNWTWTF